ncbi:hypothetical protein HNY73_019129 [Argiope bruennichi]|uniref:Uncharacterized protein n=1 Tax=Argiope bruennichi TaxID=94029 RepID=A0A8T0EJE3_ARGBR|nr:hypothetical protein HNY73_019129 [Argiope bruennichi]
MESDNKVCQLWVRKVAQDVTIFVWFKQEVISKEAWTEISFFPEIFVEIGNNLSYSVWIETYCNVFVWEDFLKNHFKRMTTTPYLFANYVSYACYLLHESTPNPFESFFYIFSLITHFVFFCWQRGRKEFIHTCVDLFCTFFEKEICKEFEDQGGWQSFKNYLENKDILIRYKELISANQPVYQLFKELQNKLLESEKPYAINGVILKDITDTQVETKKEAVNFAESVADKIKELCKKTFEEVLKDFEKTERQLEELNLQTVGEACGGTSTEEYQASSEEVQEVLENIPSKINFKNNKDREKEVKIPNTLETLYLDALKSQNFGPAPQESGLIPKSTKVERVKKLLEEMSEDIIKISELIKFLSEDYFGTDLVILDHSY